jgi:hypothetical protein
MSQLSAAHDRVEGDPEAATVARCAARGPPAGRTAVTAPQDPFSTPPKDTPGTPSGFGAPSGQPGGYGAPTGDPVGPPAGYGAPQPAGYGAPAYGQQPGFGSPHGGHMPARNGFGVAALVLGILSLPAAVTVIFGILLGVLAIIFGALGRGRAKKGEATNGGMATAGLALGIAGVVLSLLLAAFVGSLLSNSDIGGLQDCIDEAAGDAAAEQQCAEDFEDSITG